MTGAIFHSSTKTVLQVNHYELLLVASFLMVL